MEELKKLDPYSEEYKKATLKDLALDAVARKDEKALSWLKVESGKKDKRTRNGVNIEVSKNITAIRADYAKKFLGYKPKSKQSAEALRKRKQEKAEQARLALFDEAFEMLKG